MIDTDFEFLEKYHRHGGTYELPVEIVNTLTYDIEELNAKYTKALELLIDWNLPCEFEFEDGSSFMDVDSDYCETHCGIDDEQFKKCWDRYIEWLLKD